MNISSAKPTTIYSELKLSTQLLEKIKIIESKYTNLKLDFKDVAKQRDEHIAHTQRFQKLLAISQLKEKYSRKTAEKLQKFSQNLEKVRTILPISIATNKNEIKMKKNSSL
jgi:hypothetical protein